MNREVKDRGAWVCRLTELQSKKWLVDGKKCKTNGFAIRRAMQKILTSHGRLPAGIQPARTVDFLDAWLIKLFCEIFRQVSSIRAQDDGVYKSSTLTIL